MKLSYQEAAIWLKERSGFLILTHKRPDGDTIGCAAALCLTLRALGKTAWLLPNEDATALFDPYLEGLPAPAEFRPEHIVAVDTASLGLLPDSAQKYRERIELSIDHHPSNEGFAALNCVEPDKAACGEILYKIALELLGPERPLPPEIALPLYVAVSTDTGCFVYSNTRPNTHRVAAALMETGIDYPWVNKRHFRTKSYTRLRVEARIMETLELQDGGETALAAVSLADARELGATELDLEDIAGFIGQLAGVRTAVTIRELKPGECKLSVRTQADLNASRVCALLGGGGHAAASGCTVYGSVEDAKRAIMGAINAVRAGDQAGEHRSAR